MSAVETNAGQSGVAGGASADEQAQGVDAPPARDTVTPEGTTWSLKQNLIRAMWMLVGRPMFRLSFHNWYGVRRGLLRCFGAKVGPRAKIRPTCRIDIPWNVSIGADCLIGDDSILYALGPISIGDRTVISQYAHLCAGTHDYSSRSFKLIRPPVTVGSDCWIAADAFVGPGVTVGDHAVLGARSSAFKDMQAGWIYAGNPAKPIRPREITRD